MATLDVNLFVVLTATVPEREGDLLEASAEFYPDESVTSVTNTGFNAQHVSDAGVNFFSSIDALKGKAHSGEFGKLRWWLREAGTPFDSAPIDGEILEKRI